MAISYGFDHSLKYSENRNRWDLKPAMLAHREPFVRAWQFDDAALRQEIRRLVQGAGEGLSAERIQGLGEAEIGDPAAQRFANFPVPVDFHDLSQVFC